MTQAMPDERPRTGREHMKDIPPGHVDECEVRWTPNGKECYIHDEPCHP